MILHKDAILTLKECSIEEFVHAYMFLYVHLIQFNRRHGCGHVRFIYLFSCMYDVFVFKIKDPIFYLGSMSNVILFFIYL